VLRANIRREYRSADGDKTGVSTGQEVIDTVLLVTAIPPRNEADQAEV
jgi:hypothetical protein